MYMMWKRSKKFTDVIKPDDIRCYAFACPCIVSPNVYDDYEELFASKKCMHTVCLQNDIVCRLSLRSVLNLKTYISAIAPI